MSETQNCIDATLFCKVYIGRHPGAHALLHVVTITRFQKQAQQFSDSMDSRRLTTCTRTLTNINVPEFEEHGRAQSSLRLGHSQAKVLQRADRTGGQEVVLDRLERAVEAPLDL